MEWQQAGQAVGGGAHHSAPTLCRSSLTGAWERPFLPQPEGAGGSEVFGSPPHTSPLLLSISFLALLLFHPLCFLACFSANRAFFLISCLLMNEFHSSFSPFWGVGQQRGVGWSMNSYRLFLLPFFHLTIQIHGDRKWRGAAGWEAPGSEVKSGQLLNESS